MGKLVKFNPPPGVWKNGSSYEAQGRWHDSNLVRWKDGRDPKPSLFCIDSQSVEGDEGLDQKGTDGNKKVKGRKRHIITGVLGLSYSSKCQ